MKTNFEVEKKETELKLKAEAREAVSAEEKKKQQIIIYGVIGMLLIVFTFSVFLFRRFKITQRQKQIIEHQKEIVDEKQKGILDSIHYAKRIQQALMTHEVYIDRVLRKLSG